jgi:hypothetical protein
MRRCAWPVHWLMLGGSFVSLRGSMSKGLRLIHRRIAIGGAVLLLAGLAWLYESSFFAAHA